MNQKQLLTSLFCYLFFQIGCRQQSAIAPISLQFNYRSVVTDSSCAAIFYTNSPSEFAAKTRKWQGCATICDDTNGNLYSAWYTGGVYEGPGNYITMSSSKDSGKTWVDNRLIISPITQNYRHIDPILWKDPNDFLHLSWTMSDGMWDGGEGGVWDIIIKQVDGKLVFTNPKRLFPGLMNTKPLVTSKKEVIYPVFGWNFTYANSKNKWGIFTIKPTLPEINGAFVYTSTMLESSELSFPIRKSQLLIDQGIRWGDEHMIVELDPNHFFCLSRSFKGLLYTNSYDSCESWEKSQPYALISPTTDAKSFIGKLSSGNIILIVNNSSTRTNLSVFLSEDNGKTWPHKLLLDTRSNVSYPDLIQTADGKLHLSYDRERAIQKEIIHVVIDEEIIKKGNTNFIRNLISK